MHNVFISYHHDNDHHYKERLVATGSRFSAFVDRSVDTGDNSEDLSDESIRRQIRDKYLRQTTVTKPVVRASNRTPIPASAVGVTLTISENALAELDQIEAETITAVREGRKFLWR